jgi:hypothetical protein
MIVVYSTASSGYCARGPHGDTCWIILVRARPATTALFADDWRRPGQDHERAGRHPRLRRANDRHVHCPLMTSRPPSPDRDAAADGAVQHLRGFLNPLGGRIQCVRHAICQERKNPILSTRLSLVGSESDQIKDRCGIGSAGLSNYIACANTTLSVESRNNNNANKQTILPLEAVSIFARSFCAVLMET